MSFVIDFFPQCSKILKYNIKEESIKLIISKDDFTELVKRHNKIGRGESEKCLAR